MKTIHYILFLAFVLSTLALKAGDPVVANSTNKKASPEAPVLFKLLPGIPKEAAFNDLPFSPAVRFEKSIIIRVCLTGPEVAVPANETRNPDYSYLAPEVPMVADFE